MMSESVSVIVPTYNRAGYIDRTLDSIVAQTVPPSEIIVVDDGSSDDTEEVCARFGPSVRFVRQANAGVSAARNNGASLATNRWLAFCDSDDLWSREKLERQLAALRRTGARWSITSANTIDLSDAPVPNREGFRGIFPVFSRLGEAPERIFERYLASVRVEGPGAPFVCHHGDMFLPLFLGNFALPSSSMVERELFLALGGFDLSFRFAEETEFFHRLSAHSHGTVLSEELVGYRVAQANSLVSSGNIRLLIENALKSNQMAAALRLPTDPAQREHAARGRRSLLLALAKAFIAEGLPRKSREMLRAARETGISEPAISPTLAVASLLPEVLLRPALRVWRSRR